MRRVVTYKIILLVCALFVIAACGAKTKDELLKEGVKLLNEGKPSGAIAVLKTALEKDQNFFDARLQLAKAYVASGKFEQAEKEYQKLLRMNPSRADIQLELARSYIYSDKPDEALNELQRYLSAHPQTPETFELLGFGYMLQKKLDAAEQQLLQALKLEPERSSAKLGLAGIYASRGKKEEARSLLGKVIAGDGKNIKAYYMLAGLDASSGRQDSAVQLYRKIAGLNPFDSEALYRAGLLYVEKNDFDNAGKLADELLKQFPKRAAGNALKGIIYYYRKNYREAVAELQKAVSKQPHIGAYYFMGLSRYSLEEYEMALADFNKLLSYNPSFSQARLFASVILLKQKRVDTAITEIKKVLEADSGNALAYNMLGSAYMAKGMYGEAMKELNTAIELDPKLVDAHLKKGVFNFTAGNMQMAESELRAAVKIAPEVLNTRLVLASYYMKQKNYAKAISVLKDGISGKPEDAHLYNYMAGAQFKEGNTAAALASLHKAKQSNPDYFPAYYNLANYYSARGEHGKAMEEYRAVLKRDPRSVMALVNIASSYELQGKASDAFSYYTKAKDTKDPAGYFALAGYFARKKELDKAQGVLDELLKVRPDTLEALEAKGKLHMGAKKYKEAVDAFERLEAKKPERGMPLLMSAYIAMRDYKAALRKLENKLSTEPDRLELRAAMVNVYTMMGDSGKALENAELIVKRKPGSAYGYMVLASFYDKQNRLDDAISMLKKGLQVDEGNVQAALQLGGLYAKKKEYNLALATYSGISKKNPRDVQSLFAQGAVYDLMNKKKEAVRKYQEVLEKADDHVPALNNLAYLYMQGHGKKGEALDLAIRAYRLAPNDAGVVDTLGYALLKEGRTDDALKALKHAVSLVPDNPSMQYHLALAYKERGEKALALESVQKALRAKDFPEAKEASLLLNQLSGARGGR